MNSNCRLYAGGETHPGGGGDDFLPPRSIKSSSPKARVHGSRAVS
jgi:hypothetical protein